MERMEHSIIILVSNSLFRELCPRLLLWQKSLIAGLHGQTALVKLFDASSSDASKFDPKRRLGNSIEHE